jgi:hypothetical protein
MIDASEVEIVGRWIECNGKVQADETCQRIENLTTNYLIRIANSPIWGDWETLYQDPNDGRYWERFYPQGEMQGGGPPCLKSLSIAEAQSKYVIP